MSIRQLYAFPQVKHYEPRMLIHYDLEPYADRNKPVILYGFYPGATKALNLFLSKHKSTCVVVWAGSDAMRLVDPKNRGLVQELRKKKNFHHIAISKYTAADLKKVGLPYRFLLVVSTIPGFFKPVPLGTDVFYYNSHHKGEFYGVPLSEKVLSRFPGVGRQTGFSTGAGHYTFEQMPEIYARCFMGLRLTPHDGLSNTVIELGLMGRKCVCNAGYPNCIPWTTEEDIVAALRSGQDCIGQVDLEVAERVRRYINIGDAWLNEDYYR